MQRLKGESIEDYLKKIDQEKEGLTYYTNSVEVMIQNKRRSFELPKFLRAEIDRFRRIAKYDSYGEYMKIADSYEDLLNKVEAYLESFKR
jgi:hypothetical protein